VPWCLLFVLIRHGLRGGPGLNAGLERLEKMRLGTRYLCSSFLPRDFRIKSLKKRKTCARLVFTAARTRPTTVTLEYILFIGIRPRRRRRLGGGVGWGLVVGGGIVRANRRFSGIVVLSRFWALCRDSWGSMGLGGAIGTFMPPCPVGSSVSFPSALINRGGSCLPLPRVELIQKLFSKLPLVH